MDYLQIRDDRKLSSLKVMCIKQLRSLITDEDTYTVLYFKHYDNLVDTVNASDELRFSWLSKHENGVYIDDDCFLTKRFIPENNGRIHLPVSPICGHPDIFLIYVNSDTNFIKSNFNPDVRVKFIQNTLNKSEKGFYGWPVKFMYGLRNYSIIPESVYSHEYGTMNKLIEKKRQYEIKKYKKAVLIY